MDHAFGVWLSSALIASFISVDQREGAEKKSGKVTKYALTAYPGQIMALKQCNCSKIEDILNWRMCLLLVRLACTLT